MPWLVADIIVQDPCQWFEEGSLAWWLAGCWLPFAIVPPLAALALALCVAWAVRRRAVTA